MATECRPGPAISADLLLPDLLRAHPRARAVLDHYGLHGCGGPLGPHESVHFFARAHGIDEARLLGELHQAIAPAESAPSSPDPTGPSVADTIYRRYFLGAMALTLTAGATWGAWLLWTVALGGSFQAIPLHSTNAHGEAQIFGWVGLFIMGFAYQAFPRMWQTSLAAPQLAAAAFGLMIAGLAVRTIGIAGAGTWSLAIPFALIGGALEIVAVSIFAAQIVATFTRSRAAIEPYVGFVVGALAWFVASSLVSVWHSWTTMTAGSVRQLVWYVATYQGPLRDMQIHGLALFMILGVSLRMLPAFYDLPSVPDRRAWWALDLIATAVAGEILLFLLYRWTGNRTYAACLLLPWLMLAGGVGLVILPWRPWRPFPSCDRGAKFIRAAFAWLLVSLAMLLLGPVYRVASGISFSHAYHGATRHAITVGFVSLMIMGMAAKAVPTLNGVDPRELPRLWGPFALVNIGCMLRVTMQVLTDRGPGIYPLLGVSGTLEVAGLAWWGLGLARIIWRGPATTAQNEPPLEGSPPDRIDARHRVGDVLDWFPETEAVFVRRGFTAIQQPLMRRTLARQITVAQAATLRGFAPGEILEALNAAIVGRTRVPAGVPTCSPLIQIGDHP